MSENDTVLDGLMQNFFQIRSGHAKCNLQKIYDLICFGFSYFRHGINHNPNRFRCNNIQFALGTCFQMLFHVPFVFIISLVLAFRIDYLFGFLLLLVLVIIGGICAMIMKSSAPLFRKLQKSRIK